MKLLHNNDVELSRALLANLPGGVEVIEGDGGYHVSAYPSVVVTLSSKEVYLPVYGEDGGLLGVELTAIDEREVVIRMPSSWEAVYDYITYTE